VRFAFPFIGKDWPGWKTYSEGKRSIADLLNRFNINTRARGVKLLRRKASYSIPKLGMLLRSVFWILAVNELDLSFRGSRQVQRCFWFHLWAFSERSVACCAGRDFPGYAFAAGLKSYPFAYIILNHVPPVTITSDPGSQ
jgi:hypothetical protein